MKNCHKTTTAILVTGGAGFIGSNFIPYFLEKHENYRVINLDKLTYAGSLENLKEVEGHPRYYFIKGDICNRELVDYIFCEFHIKGVINFAAESHVDNSILEPDIFVRTNVLGAFTLIDAARKNWMAEPHVPRNGYADCRFYHVSTDEVYGSLEGTGLFTEKTPYDPRNPYSASKAGSDMIVRSYNRTYGLNTVITNSSNNYGPRQHREKFIPTIIRKALALEKIPVYGDGRHIRDWLHVLDHCRGIDAVFHQGESGETYSIGGKNEQENMYVVSKVCDILDEVAEHCRKKSGIGRYSELITLIADRPGHDRRYGLDTTKIENEIDWKPETDFETGLYETVKWYVKKTAKGVDHGRGQQ